ncbi:hypothetical protein OEA41_001846 [Lepraria neglecta]|uniref:Aspartokinase n=1 Tax=Lepraria neglecta TaxID=209136 RepID=A0AAE0DM95_9LECA|nr:hypothetical protein OEA41_001846 [Lepraria neglecta]
MKELDSSYVVQKFGGTSLGKLLDTITGTIIPGSLESDRVIVVCSARSGTSKSTGTTQLLLEAINHATDPSAGSGERLDSIINLIRDEHLKAIESAVVSGSVQSGPLEESIVEDCEGLRSFLHAAHTIGELSPRSQDRVIALGETLACRITAASLESKGVSAEVVLLNDIIEQAFQGSPQGPEAAYEELGAQFFEVISQKIGEAVVKCGDKVPVVTGFFGKMPTGLLQSVGRGYSDLCAAMCAVGVGARELQIWKEVDGIFTADPSKVPSARLLATVTSEEAAELTYFGSEVIHPLTMEQIQKSNIPLRLKNVKNPDGAGTVIYPTSLPSYFASVATSNGSNGYNGNTTTAYSGTSTLQSVFMRTNGYHGDGDMQNPYRRTPTAMTAKDSIVIINVLSHSNSKSHGFLAKIFERLDHHKLVVDLVTTSEKSVSLAVSSATEDESALKKATAEIGKLGTEEQALVAMNAVHANILKIPALSEQQNSFSYGQYSSGLLTVHPCIKQPSSSRKDIG